MKVHYAAEHDCSPAGIARATGRAFDDWFHELDELGGPARGRRALGEHLMGVRKLDPWWATTLLVEYEKARGVTEKDGLPVGYNICVTKSVGVPPPVVYQALLDTSWWLGGGRGAPPREGDAFEDGDGHRGTWKKLAPGKLLRFTWQGPGHQASETVEIKLAPSGAKTSIVLNHARLPDRPAADGMRAAWGRVLEALTERVA